MGKAVLGEGVNVSEVHACSKIMGDDFPATSAIGTWISKPLSD